MSEQLTKKLKHYRLNVPEYEKIKQLLGREPNNIEWALFSALWSEHCSYKSSRIHLKKFAQTINETVVTASGENAGVVDLGQGERVAFKMESHNHPSFIEPYQGAATGVGGILRDIFTMGAKPVALADYLCFGDPKAERMGVLVDGVVRGISGYGNCVGVPTVTGQTNFDSSYSKNILVNAMAVGLYRPQEPIALSKAKGVGNWVVYVGAKTGKDGVHGAAMASESFDDNTEAKKPNVQIGDPYFEKLLIESCLEVIQQNLVVAIQDMGAAGLTSSSFEMCSKGQVGMQMHLDKVPLRDSSMDPEEILLSESQERMLLVCEPSRFEDLKKVFLQWGLDAVPIGEILAERKVELWWRGEKITSIDPDLLVENAPQYERPYAAWKARSQVSDAGSLPADYSKGRQQLIEFVSNQTASSRKAIYRQYDQRVGLMTVRGSDHDVAIQRLPDSQRGLSIAVGCRPRLMKMDAQVGATDAVFYPALQMAIKGAKTIGITDCLNFGNPEKPEIMSEFVASVEAIRDSALALKAPVISGNVSFYNETLGQNIISTPATGLVGLRPHIQHIPEDVFQKADSVVYKIGLSQVRFAGLFSVKNQFFGQLHLSDLEKLYQALMKLSFSKGVLSTQMLCEGGLAMTLVKMSMGDVAVRMNKHLSDKELLEDVLYQAIFELEAGQADGFLKEAQAWNLEVEEIGRTQTGSLELRKDFVFDTAELKKNYESGLRRVIENLA